MKLREIFETVPQKGSEEQAVDVKTDKEQDTSLKTIGICYGRWNPPHKGHRAAWKQASSNPIWFVGTNKNTEGPKDPLPYDIKLQCMAAVWPAVAKHVIPEQDLFSMCANIYQEYGGNVHLKIYTDEQWLYNAVMKYNGMKDQQHGTYNFAQIDWAKTERLASATNLRAAVRKGDEDSFYNDAGVRPDAMVLINGEAVPMFDAVAHYMNQYPEKPTKGKKAAVASSELAEQIKAMELELQESSQEKISKRKQQSTNGLNTYGDSERMSGDYTAYRLGMAVAGSNGKDPLPIDMKAKSWIGKSKSTHPYTKEEQDMLKQAYKVVGANYKDLNNGDMKSKELDTTYKVSPVAKPKKNKYGV